MASFPLCNDGRTFTCIQNSCLENLILSATCLISLFLFSLSRFCHRQHGCRRLGCKLEPSSDEDVRNTSATGQYITKISPLIAILEALGLLADIIIGVVLLLHGGAPQDCPLAFSSVLFSVYLLLILAGRIYINEFYLRSHSICMYGVGWLCTASIVPSMYVEQYGLLRWIATLARLTIFTTLCLFHCIAPRVQIQMSYRNDVLSSKPGRDETASLLSRLTFFWINSLVWRAFRRPLDASDLFQLNRNQTLAILAPRFRATAATLPLLWRIYQFFKYDCLRQGAWAALTSVAVFVPPILMRLILQYLEAQNEMSRSTAWLCVSGLLISGLLAGIADSQCNWLGRNIGAKLRAILMTEIYAKVLRKSIARPLQATLKPDSNKKANTESHASDGNILNLISVDVEIISEISASLHHVWVTFPVQTIIGIYLLYRILGVSGVAGVVFVIALLPLNIFVSQRLMAAQGYVLEASDARIQASNELLHNIRTIKYCALEVPFKERVLERRGPEMKRMRSRFVWWSISLTLFYSLPFIMTVLTFFIYTIVLGNSLETSIAFPALAVFAVLRIPLNRMADSITFLLQAHVSLLRICEFFKEPETGKYIRLSRNDTSFVGFDNATLAWPASRSTNPSDEGCIMLTEMPSTRPFRLQSLRIAFQQNALNVICGPSGCGKSSLLLALLGEMDLVRGQVFFPRDDRKSDLIGLQTSTNYSLETIVYCPQEPWIMNRSIRANILMGLPFDDSRYESVLHAVALLQDLAALDRRDQTLAGENGSRLSGGQKQRVALARALYSHSKYVLLDDCLSAIDPRTANHIVFHALKGPLMRGRTCILATHQTQLAFPRCEHIVILDAGQVKAQGSSEELVSAGFIGADVIEDKEVTPRPISWDEKFIETPKLAQGLDSLSLKSSSLEVESLPGDFRFQAEKQETKPDYGERKSEGAVPWPVVRAYLVAMGSVRFWIILLLGFAVQQLAALGTSLWIKEWTFQNDKLKMDPTTVSYSEEDARKPKNIGSWYYLTIYSVIGISYALITLLRDLIVFYGSLKASSQIYERLLNSILYAELLFFDRVPLGQILNRFSRDVQVMDQSLATFSISAFQIAATLAVIVVLISIFLPAFLLVSIIIFFAYLCVAAVYIRGARDFKRIEAVERSPLYQQFGETLAGCVSIRAYARTAMFTAQIYELVDRLNQPYILQWASKEWVTVRIKFLSSVISFSTGAFVLWKLDSIDPGAAGLVLTYAAAFAENVPWLVEIYAFIQQDLNSIDRIVEYTEVEQEAVKPPKTATQTLPYNWPSQGAIRFRDYTTRYAPELEPALKQISLDIRKGERVAIVGRTGAGKSTLALALIRALEADGGQIEIDGIDIASVTLRQLRQVVTIVPQDPELFNGSLRDNLSPLQRHNDDEMLEVLRAVRLLGGTDPGSITYSDLDSAADILSRGQRQLLCIARGLLRRSRVLVLDEATASVDYATHEAIQVGMRATIAAGTTVLAIAHRLLAIADYDRVVVLDGGRVVEQGSIRELLGRRGEGAKFRRLCEESGDIEEIEKAATLALGADNMDS